MPNPVIVEIEHLVGEVKTPQSAIAFLANLVSAFGMAGILSAPLTGWLQGVLGAALALVLAVANRPVLTAVLRRGAKKVGRPWAGGNPLD
jgi:membrane protein implicated in regulation of membrane protease activity